MHAGHLSVSIQKAQCNRADGDFYVAAKIDGVGKACSETYTATELNNLRSEELALFVPPRCAKTMQFLVYQTHGDESEEDELIGEGSLALDEMKVEKKTVKVGVVDKIGKNCGEVEATVRLFPCRTPGKMRDELGRELIDEETVSMGPHDGPRRINERSQYSVPRRRRSADI